MAHFHSNVRALLAVVTLTVAASLLHAQTDDDESTKVTPELRAAETKAKQDFASSDWATAFQEFKALHAQIPANATISEFLGEAALNLRKQSFTIELLQPIAQSSPNHWLAVALLARAYAETNQDASRDSEIAALQALHDGGHHPRLSKMQQFLLEKHAAPNGGDISIWYSLEPWGHFKAYLYARYTDAAGKERSYMTLESSDMDQISWAKDHAKEAAAGERLFSLDAYTVPVPNGNGGTTSTHATMGFYDGKPPYNLIRDRMITSVASPKQAPPTMPSVLPANPTGSAYPHSKNSAQVSASKIVCHSRGNLPFFGDRNAVKELV